MINSGKCPKCDKTISSVNAETVSATVDVTEKWNAVSYCCPSCHAVLSVQIDPVAIKTDILKALGK